jgi:hypothetical protein
VSVVRKKFVFDLRLVECDGLVFAKTGEVLVDNMKTAVDKVARKGKGRLVNERFAVMCSHYLFEPDFCNVASGWEKGASFEFVVGGFGGSRAGVSPA